MDFAETASGTSSLCDTGGTADLLKKLEARVAALESEHPEKLVEVWAEDETRLGLLPVHRRVWAKKGV